MGMMNYFFTAKCALKHHTKLSINPEQKVLHHRQFSFIIFLLENTFRSLNQATSKRSKYHRTVKTTSPCIQTKGKSRDLYSGVYRTAIIGTCASLLGPHGAIWYTCFLRVVFFFHLQDVVMTHFIPFGLLKSDFIQDIFRFTRQCQTLLSSWNLSGGKSLSKYFGAAHTALTHTFDLETSELDEGSVL